MLDLRLVCLMYMKGGIMSINAAAAKFILYEKLRELDRSQPYNEGDYVRILDTLNRIARHVYVNLLYDLRDKRLTNEP